MENLRPYLEKLLKDGYPRNWVRAVAYVCVNYPSVYEILEMYCEEWDENEKLEIIQDLMEMREEVLFRDDWEKEINYLFKRKKNR